MLPAEMEGALQGVSFVDYVEPDTSVEVCGALTEDDIVAQAIGEDVEEEDNGGEAEDVPIMPSASQVMEA